MNKLFLEALRRHGPFAAGMLIVLAILWWTLRSAAQERANIFDAQMDYIMDVRVKLVEMEKACQR